VKTACGDEYEHGRAQPAQVQALVLLLARVLALGLLTLVRWRVLELQSVPTAMRLSVLTPVATLELTTLRLAVWVLAAAAAAAETLGQAMPRQMHAPPRLK